MKKLLLLLPILLLFSCVTGDQVTQSALRSVQKRYPYSKIYLAEGATKRFIVVDSSGVKEVQCFSNNNSISNTYQLLQLK